MLNRLCWENICITMAPFEQSSLFQYVQILPDRDLAYLQPVCQLLDPYLALLFQELDYTLAAFVHRQQGRLCQQGRLRLFCRSSLVPNLAHMLSPLSSNSLVLSVVWRYEF